MKPILSNTVRGTNNVSTTSNNTEVKRGKSDQNSSKLMQILYLLPPTSRGNNSLTTIIYSKFSENLLKVLDAAASVVSKLNDLHTKRKDALEIVATLFT